MFMVMVVAAKKCVIQNAEIVIVVTAQDFMEANHRGPVFFYFCVMLNFF